MVWTRNLFMWNKNRVVLRTTAPCISCTVNRILFFLMLLSNSIVYWAGKIAAVHIVHTISSHYWVGISRVHIHALAVRLYVLSPCGQLFKPSGTRHEFPERRTPTYSIYNTRFVDTLNNTSFLPQQGFEPGISSCGTRKYSFCARLRLPLAAP